MLITLRSNASRSSIGRSDSAASGARRKAAAVRTKMHSVIVIARMMVRALKLRKAFSSLFGLQTLTVGLWGMDRASSSA